MSLVGKLAFVTGAGSGIGKSTCQILAREGATVIAADKNCKNIEDTIKIVSKINNNNHASIGLDISKTSSVQKTLEQILKSYPHPPSILVNCAGITRDNWLTKMSEDDFQEVLNVNLTGTFRIMQQFTNAILKDKTVTNASIVNIASIVAKVGNIGQANYASSKAGVQLLTKVAAKELGPKGIRVNTILPGMILTPMFEAVPDQVKAKFLSVVPLGRFGKPEEVAELIAFLASDKSSYITGANIEVTGGFGM